MIWSNLAQELGLDEKYVNKYKCRIIMPIYLSGNEKSIFIFYTVMRAHQCNHCAEKTHCNYRKIRKVHKNSCWPCLFIVHLSVNCTANRTLFDVVRKLISASSTLKHIAPPCAFYVNIISRLFNIVNVFCFLNLHQYNVTWSR